MEHHNDEQAAVNAASSMSRRAVAHTPTSILSFAPFATLLTIVGYVAYDRIFPLLSPSSTNGKQRTSSRLPGASFKGWATYLSDRAAAMTFAVTTALAAVLAQLIFCEIADVFDPAARRLALEATIKSLVASLIVVIPALEIHSITAALGLTGREKGRWFLGLLLDVLGLAMWLAGFWSVGKIVLESHQIHDNSSNADNSSAWYFYRRWSVMHKTSHGLSQGSLERIGIIGISLMASLAGFAAISSIWQSFGARHRKVTETDLARKQAGLEATSDLLLAKESRLRAVERRLSFNPAEKSLMTRLTSSFRPNAETQELLSLQMEISGLETMQTSLSSSLSLLKSRLRSQRAATTPLGRVCMTTSYVFSLYCIYRIIATSLATFRRWWHPQATFASTDPITNSLALIAAVYDPTLDRAAWSRQIAFLLSGLMLLLSFNAVLQTVLLFSRFAPRSLLQGGRLKGNFALLVAQICATYVVSAALLLRTNLPREMGSVIEGALGAPLDVGMCERMFEMTFLGTCAVTAVGIGLGRKLGANGGDWDEFDDDTGFDGDMEGGKRFD
jgi:hypothetical protein